VRWIDGRRLGGIRVERAEGRRPGGQAYLPLAGRRGLCMHTTEGDTVDGAVSVLRSNFSAPHFVTGQGRIVQMRPLDAQAATLRAHNDLYWQVECVERSRQGLWLFKESTLKPTVALMLFFRDDLGVPMRTVDGWRDDLRDITTILATDNTRRRSRKALDHRGVLMHLDVPDQGPSWHWDCGAQRWARVFELVQEGDMDADDVRRIVANALNVRVEALGELGHTAMGVKAFVDGTDPANATRKATADALRANKGEKGDKGDPGEPGTVDPAKSYHIVEEA
jgi:hypothetical protein